MTIRVKCEKCRKKISVDEAFAGGVCRCPFCEAITYVPGGPMERQGARPAAPTSRPLSPTAKPSAADTPGDAEVPVAVPVRHTALLIGLCAAGAALLIVAIVLVLAFWGFGWGAGADQPTPVTSPWRADGPSIATVPLATPVVYVVDSNLSMSKYDTARALVLHSIVSLTASGKFNVVAWQDGAAVAMASDWISAGDDGCRAARDFIPEIPPRGGTREVLKAALALSPSQVVLLAGTLPADLAEVAKGSGVSVAVVAIDADADTRDVAKALAEATGGEAKAIEYADLDGFWEAASKAWPLPD